MKRIASILAALLMLSGVCHGEDRVIGSQSRGFWRVATNGNNRTHSWFDVQGGTITTSSTYRIHTFTSSGTLVIEGRAPALDFLIVGGGGGGGTAGSVAGGGGGGAGGFTNATELAMTSGVFTVTVGAGGTNAQSGSGSSVFGIAMDGGGRGGAVASPGASGASGGGAGGSTTQTKAGGAGTPPYGMNGGSVTNVAKAAGGGGFGAVGLGGSSSAGGNGGAGGSSTISGSTVWYAAGGGGGVPTDKTAGTGGSGVGGAGGVALPGANATENSGAGGGGGGAPSCIGGYGAAGIVVVRYAMP